MTKHQGDYGPGRCRGCRYWRPLSQSGSDRLWYACHFLLETGRSRRFWLPGDCRAYAEAKEGRCESFSRL